MHSCFQAKRINKQLKANEIIPMFKIPGRDKPKDLENYANKITSIHRKGKCFCNTLKTFLKTRVFTGFHKRSINSRFGCLPMKNDVSIWYQKRAPDTSE